MDADAHVNYDQAYWAVAMLWFMCTTLLFRHRLGYATRQAHDLARVTSQRGIDHIRGALSAAALGIARRLTQLVAERTINKNATAGFVTSRAEQRRTLVRRASWSGSVCVPRDTCTLRDDQPTAHTNGTAPLGKMRSIKYESTRTALNDPKNASCDISAGTDSNARAGNRVATSCICAAFATETDHMQTAASPKPTGDKTKDANDNINDEEDDAAARLVSTLDRLRLSERRAYRRALSADAIGAACSPITFQRRASVDLSGRYPEDDDVAPMARPYKYSSGGAHRHRLSRAIVDRAPQIHQTKQPQLQTRRHRDRSPKARRRERDDDPSDDNFNDDYDYDDNDDDDDGNNRVDHNDDSGLINPPTRANSGASRPRQGKFAAAISAMAPSDCRRKIRRSARVSDGDQEDNSAKDDGWHIIVDVEESDAYENEGACIQAFGDSMHGDSHGDSMHGDNWNKADAVRCEIYPGSYDNVDDAGSHVCVDRCEFEYAGTAGGMQPPLDRASPECPRFVTALEVDHERDKPTATALPLPMRCETSPPAISPPVPPDRLGSPPMPIVQLSPSLPLSSSSSLPLSPTSLASFIEKSPTYGHGHGRGQPRSPHTNTTLTNKDTAPNKPATRAQNADEQRASRAKPCGVTHEDRGGAASIPCAGSTTCLQDVRHFCTDTKRVPRDRHARPAARETQAESGGTSWWTREARRVAADLTKHELSVLCEIAEAPKHDRARVRARLDSELTPRLALLLGQDERD